MARYAASLAKRTSSAAAKATSARLGTTTDRGEQLPESMTAREFQLIYILLGDPLVHHSRRRLLCCRQDLRASRPASRLKMEQNSRFQQRQTKQFIEQASRVAYFGDGGVVAKVGLLVCKHHAAAAAAQHHHAAWDQALALPCKENGQRVCDVSLKYHRWLKDTCDCVSLALAIVGCQGQGVLSVEQVLVLTRTLAARQAEKHIFARSNMQTCRTEPQHDFAIRRE